MNIEIDKIKKDLIVDLKRFSVTLSPFFLGVLLFPLLYLFFLKDGLYIYNIEFYFVLSWMIYTGLSMDDIRGGTKKPMKTKKETDIDIDRDSVLGGLYFYVLFYVLVVEAILFFPAIILHELTHYFFAYIFGLNPRLYLGLNPAVYFEI